nr:sterile alpha motif domain-containing protein 1-like [Pan paniscus]
MRARGDLPHSIGHRWRRQGAEGPPAGAFLTFPSSSGPAGEDSIRRVANPRERLASPAAEPGAGPEVGGLLQPPPPPARSGPRRDAPWRAPAGARRPPPVPPRLLEPPGRPEGPDARAADDAGARARAGPGRGAAACAPGSPAPRSLRRGRRQRRARRRRLRPPLPLRPPPPLRSSRLPGSSRLFSPSWRGGGGASQAEPGAGRRGEEEEEAEDEEKEEERGESCFPPPGCRRSPISRSLKLDPESGARDCITDYIRLYRASRSHIRGGALAGGGGVGGGERDKGGRIKCTHARTPRRARCLPRAAEKPRVGFLLSAFSRSRGVAPLAGWMMDGGRQDGHTDEWREGSEGLCLGNAGPLDRYPEGAFPEGKTLEK